MDRYNIRNIYLDEQFIIDILNRYGINKKPKNLNLYQVAFIHKSYTKKEDSSHISKIYNDDNNIVKFMDISNERFELVGDSIISMVLVEYLFHRFQNEDEGVLTRLKTIIVSCSYFAKFSKKLGFGKYILLSNAFENIYNGREVDSILEDVFESFICALKLDLGLGVVKKLLINIIEENINFPKLLFNNTNYKDRLTKISQRDKKQVKFVSRTILGPQDKRTYFITIHYDNKNTGITGFSFNKKDAEQKASLKYLKKNNMISEEELRIINKSN